MSQLCQYRVYIAVTIFADFSYIQCSEPVVIVFVRVSNLFDIGVLAMYWTLVCVLNGK